MNRRWKQRRRDLLVDRLARQTEDQAWIGRQEAYGAAIMHSILRVDARARLEKLLAG